MKFKTDENLPIEVADVLRQAGHDALTVHDQRLTGHPDLLIWMLPQSAALKAASW